MAANLAVKNLSAFFRLHISPDGTSMVTAHSEKILVGVAAVGSATWGKDENVVPPKGTQWIEASVKGTEGHWCPGKKAPWT